MNKQVIFDKILFWLIQISYLILFSMALYFYKERLTTDTSYYFFKTLNTNHFWIEHQRIVLAIAELPVIIFSRFGCSLQSIAMSFSAWHVLFFYLSGAYLYWRYKNLYAWLLLLLLQLIGIQYGFICPIFEQYYGTAIGIIFYVELKQVAHRNWLQKLLLIILWLFLLLSHPFNLILGLYILATDFVAEKKFHKYIPYLVLIIPLLIFKKLTASEYESGKMNWIFDLVHNKTYQQLFDLGYYKKALAYLKNDYLELGVCLIISVLYAIISKKEKGFLVMIMFLLGTLFLVNMSYSMIEFSGYNEQLYFLLVPIILIPLILDYLANTKALFIKYAFMFLVIVSIVLRIQGQYKMAIHNSARVKKVEAWIAKARLKPGQKFYVEKSAYKEIETILGWDIPYFSILLSSMHATQKTITIFPLENDNRINLEKSNKESYIFRNGEIEKIETLNPQYFSLNKQEIIYKPLY